MSQWPESKAKWLKQELQQLCLCSLALLELTDSDLIHEWKHIHAYRTFFILCWFGDDYLWLHCVDPDVIFFYEYFCDMFSNYFDVAHTLQYKCSSFNMLLWYSFKVASHNWFEWILWKVIIIMYKQSHQFKMGPITSFWSQDTLIVFFLTSDQPKRFTPQVTFIHFQCWWMQRGHFSLKTPIWNSFLPTGDTLLWRSLALNNWQHITFYLIPSFSSEYAEKYAAR